ncbi:MAG TPA: GNAT family N-acetyltransferase [Chryseosolibacter sp.]|nr:GNAT family N-acetyltransferase [Chryseosolibacter sp.]
MITIRKATVEDISTLVDFQVRLALETENLQLDVKILTKGIQSLLSDPSKGFYNIAVDNNHIVGCHMITYEWSDWRNGMIWWLQSVYVVDAYRKKGVFKLMFEHISQQAKNSGIAGLRLYVDKTNTRAQKVYESMGMNGEHYSVYELMFQ